ncbi:MAG: bifunctional tetrahydrofolate synthase/dihydrofolate synthase [Proteobacteria bacterium]|nr:bifunctional tetrahydrofolate synthase/dihydrofolate synthase [Pseudomonadota bacterium]
MPDTLDDWLIHLEALHPRGVAGIELGLERVAEVSRALGQRRKVPVITVAGTNGKGSTCAMLECILRCAGYRVGLYTSPHLLAYNERVRIAGQAVDSASLCRSFARVEAARAAKALTYFEFGTLAAWECFAEAAVDVVILEVGLGGRLDAVNIYASDCAIVTGIDIDHTDYLGATREAIGFEKAGIFRTGKAAICADPDPPRSLIGHAQAIGTDLHLIGRDFGYQRQDGQWQFWAREGDKISRRSGLAHPALRGATQLQNASAVLAVLQALQELLPVAMQDIRRGLLEVELPGRFQVIPGRPLLVLDVAHNPQAARVLADNLGSQLGDGAYHPKTWAVFGMLRDKDVAAVVASLAGRVTHWLPCSLTGSRAASADELAQALEGQGIAVPHRFGSALAAFRFAQENAGDDDRILVFGSFQTVADILREVA